MNYEKLKIRLFAFSACYGPLGMESRKIKISQLTASSKWSGYWNAVYARLNSGRFWGPGGTYGQWLQIAFERETAVMKVATQGSVAKNYWVRNYKISSSKDALTWNFIMKNGAKKVCWVTHWLNMDENLIKSSRVDSSWSSLTVSAWYCWSVQPFISPGLHVWDSVPDSTFARSKHRSCCRFSRESRIPI